MIWLKIIERKPLCDPNRMKSIIEECDELIAILTASVRTAQEHQQSPGRACDNRTRVSSLYLWAFLV